MNSRSRSSQLFFNPLRFILPLLTQKCPKEIKYIYIYIAVSNSLQKYLKRENILRYCCANKLFLIKKKKTIDTYNYKPKNQIIKLCNKTKNCAP